MALSTWWQGDLLPSLSSLTAFHIDDSVDATFLAVLMHEDKHTVLERIAFGHHPYVALLGETPVGYGWVAERSATIGELRLSFALPATDRYLWDFATLPAFRGRSVYPHLLQGILTQQRQTADRFWIIYAPENHASGTGIRKAGFQPVDELSFSVGGGVGLVPLVSERRALVGAALLGLPMLDEQTIIPCWRCAAVQQGAPCWPEEHSSSLAPVCACVHPEPKVGNHVSFCS